MTEKQSLNLLLLDDAIPKFTGSDKTYSATKWAQDVDDNAEIFGLTPQQKLLIARRSLTSTAAMWLRTEKPFKTYDELKAAIIKEFPDTTNTKEIHELMSQRRKRKDETCYEYMLEMKELGKGGKLADYVAIQYIIDGIIDHEANKTLLYGASTYPELKEKFKLYEAYKKNLRKRYDEDQTRTMRSDTQSQPASNVIGGKQQYPTKRCYNCGNTNHISSACPEQGRKCFSCNSFGHISMECPAKKTATMATTTGAATTSRVFPKTDTSKPERARTSSASGNIRSTSAPFGKQTFFNTATHDDSGGATGDYDVQDEQLHVGVFFASSSVNCTTSIARDVGITARESEAVIGSSGKMVDVDRSGHSGRTLTSKMSKSNETEADFTTYDVNKHHGGKTERLKPVKLVKMCNKATNALIDSGSDVNLVSDEFCNELGTRQCGNNRDITLCGLGGARVKSIGTITTPVSIDERIYDEVLFYVVPKDCMPFKIILGNDFLKNVTMFMSGSSVWLRPRDDEWLDCLLCEYDEVCVPSTDHIKDPLLRDEVQQLVKTYRPNQVKEAPIQMKIIVKDDIPVVHRPRRMSLKEQLEVEQQIAEWLDKGIIQNSTLWYKHVERVQKALNSTFQRSINTSPLELLVEKKMKMKEGIEIYKLLQQEERESYAQTRDELRERAKQQLLQVQEENKRTFDKKRKENRKYTAEGELVAIQRTQFGPGLKLKLKYLGPDVATKVKRNDRYDVEKTDNQAEGPNKTSTSADHMKPWPDSF